MKNFWIGAVIVGISLLGAGPARAALSLTLSDGNPFDEQVLTDSGSPGEILGNDAIVGNWSINEIVGFAFNGSGPLLDLAYGLEAKPGNNSVLTITLTETGYQPRGSSINEIFLALGGVANSSSATQKGIINGSVLGSQGPFGSDAYSGERILTFDPLNGDEFSFSEQLVFTGTGHNSGDAELEFGTVPEPGTAWAGIFAGACGFCVVFARALKAPRR